MTEIDFSTLPTLEQINAAEDSQIDDYLELLDNFTPVDYLKFALDGLDTVDDLVFALHATAAQYKKWADEGWVLREAVDGGRVAFTRPDIEALYDALYERAEEIGHWQ